MHIISSYLLEPFCSNESVGCMLWYLEVAILVYGIVHDSHVIWVFGFSLNSFIFNLSC